MSEHLPLPPELLRGGPPGVHDEAEIVRLMRLGDRGEYLEAAHEASQLLLRHGQDTRLAAVYLVGSFFERGPSGLPDLFDSVAGEFQPRAGEREDLARTREAAARWLCRALTTQIAFHTATRSDIWKRWAAEITSEELREIEAKSVELCETCPSCAGTFAKIGRWAQERLTPASASARKAREEQARAAQSTLAAQSERSLDPDPKLGQRGWDEAEPAPEAEADPEPEAGADPEPEPEPDAEFEPEGEPHEGEHRRDGDFAHFGEQSLEQVGGYDEDFDPTRNYLGEPHFARPEPHFDTSKAEAHADAGVGQGPCLAARRESDPRGPFEAAALLELCEKLEGFEILVERGELDKAAIIASDVQAVIENFDPLVYLPRLFGRYFQLLSKIVGEVEARWDAGDSTARRVLEQYYRADLDGFVNE